MLLIDMPNLCMREAFAKAGLTHHGRPSSVVFGALQQIRSLLNRFPGEAAFCWDSERSLRREFWSGYKANRRGREPNQAALDAYPQMALLREEILPWIGLPNQILQDGYEADDLIGSLCMNYRKSMIIVSSDNDLYQFLSPRVINYNLGKKSIYTHKDFMDEYNSTPLQWIEAKAIAGDTSDGIDGVPGVGIKTAIKFLIGQAGAKTGAKIMDHVEIRIRNRKLVRLPWPGCNSGPIRSSRLDEREFRLVCAEWGLESLAR